jgi:hypothetical protein
MNNKIIQDIVGLCFTNSSLVHITIDINPHLLKNKNLTASKIHRLLSNSKQVIGKKTNRDFWQEFITGGFYITKNTENCITIIYFLNPRLELNHILVNNIKIRIKKIIWSKIEIKSKPTLNIIDDNLIDSRYNNIRFIGGAHLIKNRILTT